ncbi:nitroreductase family deazaflavin-dependent oxidoreductase [Mycolicibacterium moriokaense]|nr:nitroreductase family deazaflavin-dependent oxidoreductase [Mycolicibacterium moriokaense]
MSTDAIQGIPRVDLEARPLWKRNLNHWTGGWLLTTDAGKALWRKAIAPIEAPLMKATRGRIRISFSAPVAVLTSIGARTGELRESTLTYFTDGDYVILIASNYGSAHHPGWYHNLIAKPECELHIGERGGRFIAREATGADRDRLYSLAGRRLNRVFESYTARSGPRTIPVMRLSPA